MPKINFKKYKWIKAPWNKGYVLVSKQYLKLFTKAPFKRRNDA
jgi:hypothetical protein|tara:strand:- start:109 stop:237 length:129 start_codon:yes stop_codon:yes gene_type:complete